MINVRNNKMKRSALMLSLTLSAALASPLALADKPHHMRKSFTTDVTRSTGEGRSMHRHTEQNANRYGFERSSTVTTGSGHSANRNVAASYDPESKSYHKSIDGQRMNGDTYAAERNTQRTDDGYHREMHRTNANGDTAHKEVSVAMDRDNHTLTKNVSVTGFNGETHSATVTKTRTGGDD